MEDRTKRGTPGDDRPKRVDQEVGDPMLQHSAADSDPFTAELVERPSAGAQAHAPLPGTSSVRKSFGANVVEAGEQAWGKTDWLAVAMIPAMLTAYALLSVFLLSQRGRGLDLLSDEPLISLIVLLGGIAVGLMLMLWGAARREEGLEDLAVPLFFSIVQGVGNLVLLVWTIVSERFRIFDTDYQMIVLWGVPAIGLSIVILTELIRRHLSGLIFLGLTLIFLSIAIMHCTLIAVISLSI